MDQRCIICDKTGNDCIIIKSTAIQTLIESSKKRRDNKYKLWSRLTSAYVHTTCSKTYNKESSIQSAISTGSKRAKEGKKIIKNAREFDFTVNCFICGEICDYKHQKICLVKTPEIAVTIKDKLNEKKLTDTFHKNLSTRLVNNRDLVSAQARYHRHCLPQFSNKRSSDQTGRPRSESTQDFLNFMIEYFENNREIQYSLNEIKEGFTGKLPEIRQYARTYPQNQLEFVRTKQDLIIIFKNKITY